MLDASISAASSRRWLTGLTTTPASTDARYARSAGGLDLITELPSPNIQVRARRQLQPEQSLVDSHRCFRGWSSMVNCVYDKRGAWSVARSRQPPSTCELLLFTMRYSFSPNHLRVARCALIVLCVTCSLHVVPVAMRADETPVAVEEAPPLDFNPTEKSTLAWLSEPLEVPHASAKNAADMKPYVEPLAGTNVAFKMLPIPGGRLLMGSPDSEAGRKPDEGPQREVEIEPFWMGKHEVTWSEFELWALDAGVPARNDSKMTAQPRSELLADAITRPTKPFADLTFGMGKANRPAICMTQLSARCYCKWLSAKTGRYYRLPTEAEWEYACRAGTNSAFSFGAATDEPDDYAWYFDNGSDRYHEIGTRRPNPWGLYDMHGNVSEWVLDNYSADAYRRLAAAAAQRPVVIKDRDAPYVVRGGSWDSDPAQLRSAARDYSRPAWKDDDPRNPQSIWYNTEMTCPGFRVVRPLRMPTTEESALYEPDWKAILDYSRRQTAEHSE